MNQVNQEMADQRKALHVLALAGWTFGSIAAVSLVLALSLRLAGAWQITLFSGSLIATSVAWRKIPWHDQWAKYLSFGGALLLAYAANRIFYIVDMILIGQKLDFWPVDSASPELAVVKAEVATMLGVFLVIACWVKAGGLRHSPRALISVDWQERQIVFGLLYVVSLAAVLVSNISRNVAESFGQLLPNLHAAGTAAAFFLCLSSSKVSPRRLAMLFILTLPFLYASLGTGMKEGTIVAMLPLAFLLWLTLRNILVRLCLVIAGLIVVGLVASYVTRYRAEVWYGGRDLSPRESLSEFYSDSERAGFGITALQGIVDFLARSNASENRAWAVAIADEYGNEPELVFAPMAYVFVPRLIWAEKPAIRQGWEYSGLLFGSQYLAWSESSTAAGFFTGLYLGAGWPAVAGGAIFTGLMVGGLMNLARKIGGGMLMPIYGFCLIQYALRLDESWTVGALTGPIISFVYITGIFLIARLFLARSGIENASSAMSASSTDTNAFPA